MADLVRRRFLFFIDITPTGQVVARGLNSDFVIRAETVADLRRALVEEMGERGLDWRVVGVHTDSPIAQA